MMPDADYTLLYPPIIQFGWGRRVALASILDRLSGSAPSHVLFVATNTAATNGQLAELERLCPGDHDRLVGIPHDPALDVVASIRDQARQCGANVVVAVGGGSAIDAAKAAAVLTHADGTVDDYFHGRHSIDGPGLPVVALPTTAGTGAEITKNSVLTDTEANVKKSLRSPHMVPFAAIVDPELTVTMPPALTAESGMDALTQAIEAFISLNAHAASSALAAKATRLLLDSLPAAWRDGGDRLARTAVAEGSLLSAMAFSQSGLGAVHGLAHPLGLALNLAHGRTCAILLPHILRWNAPTCDEQLQELATLTGRPSASALTREVEVLCEQLEIPTDFSQHGLHESHEEAILRNCRSGSMKANPRPLTDDDVRALLKTLAGATAANA
ncbi:MAG: iron-containing alcohol dehydrogenase [Lentisphaerae bacterium]|jgi:alcohol dehydrogenase class IV|nr:iron-containing alcohol dehydrogenase [Lentisphaerota bacterium]MBT4818359.1 iron-containing alcohol dehydrogenase [Lentisphaerota bacterium]MBT5607914.1 iron-containing alcohol dehydrogenase [Lentisphaerota bacterium]MBT7056566.1 iron-containing alcohol dehydrogenase [Lentisphaerota bacterium]MBT7846357.1 iron-containing alcohol dehydrogenase [Lentisphaerota bacterium]